MMLVVMGEPPHYREWLAPLPHGLRIAASAQQPAAVHLFTAKRSELKQRLTALRKSLEPDGFVWVSWPRKSSGVETDVSEDAIRALALPLGFVDVKVCAVSDVWSGLKLVIRRTVRYQKHKGGRTPGGTEEVKSRYGNRRREEVGTETEEGRNRDGNRRRKESGRK